MYNSTKTLIIAEAGVNHNGDYDTAMELINAAADAGADVVKFQTFHAKNIVSKYAPKAKYQKESTGAGENQLSMLSQLELPQKWHKDLITQCKKRNIAFLSTAFDLDSIDFLASLSLGIWKIPSGEITNLPYLRKIGTLKEHIILSTGMSTLHEVQAAISILEQAGTCPKQISLLHCTTEYPAPFTDINLHTLHTLKASFPLCKGIGYSDHSIGIEIALAAVALGATIIEKHFTLDKNFDGPDHKASLDPHELKAMVQGIRRIELALGEGTKEPAPSEKPNIFIVRKSIVAKKFIKKGTIFSEDNITTKRPGNGISPMFWDTVLGNVALKDFEEDEQITLTLT